MKTSLAAVLGAVLVCILPARAHAAALEAGGELRVRAWRLDDYLKGERPGDFWDQRLRLALDWPVGGQTLVHARADIRGETWADSARTPAIVFDQVNAQFVWPGAPVRFSVGRQDVSWGTGYWVQEDNRDRLAVGLKLDPVAVQFAYDKFVEVHLLERGRDDSRAWAVGAIANAAGFRFGLLLANLRDESRTRFPAGDLSYWAAGLFAIGSAGPIATRAEAVYGAGTIDRAGTGDLDVRGIGAYAAAAAPLGPVTLTLEGAYAGGDDPKTTGRNEGFFSADYQGPYWSMIFYNDLDIPGYAGDPQSSSPEADFSVRNARSGKLSASFSPVRRLTVTGAALYAAADRTREGVAASLGWEFDVVAVYALSQNVTVTAGSGYAVLGDYWRPAATGDGPRAMPENPLAVVLAVTTRF
jgi:hypothetical protein